MLSAFRCQTQQLVSLDYFPCEAKIAAFNLAHITVSAMKNDSFDHVRLKISVYSIVISGHVVENLFTVFDDRVMVQLVRISLEIRTTELGGLGLL